MKIMLWRPDNAVLGLPKPLAKDRVEAAMSIVMLDLALPSAEITNGMYKKPIEAIVKEYRYDPLPDEVRAVIVASWKGGGLLSPAAVEEILPAQNVKRDAAYRSASDFPWCGSSSCPYYLLLRFTPQGRRFYKRAIGYLL
jgi:hypothetical protein